LRNHVVGHEGRLNTKNQSPNTKQPGEKHQPPISNHQTNINSPTPTPAALRHGTNWAGTGTIGIWKLFGVWRLEFGVLDPLLATCSARLTACKFRAVAKPDADVPFEEALQKLETIVDAMESGELPLESLMAKFEEGTRLAKVCQTKLAQAETKIQQLEKNSAGDLTLRPVETTND
jgi:exodeoxyribonuclease VII small subunit